MTNGVRSLLLCVIIGLLTSTASSVSATHSSDYIVRFTNANWWDPAPEFRSPNRTTTTGTTDEWNRINSKWNQPRNGGTNPHHGFDIQNGTDKDVFAVYRACVHRVGDYEIVLRIDYNNNQVDCTNPDDNWYFQYRHLAPLSTIKAGDLVTASTKIGDVQKEGSYPVHLYVGVIPRQSTSYSANIWGENDYWFVDSGSVWQSGADLDFITRPYVSTTNQLYITAYSATDDTTNRYPAKEVWVFHRHESNSTQWRQDKMTTTSGLYRWTVDFRTLKYVHKDGSLRSYQGGDWVQFIVRAHRTCDDTWDSNPYNGVVNSCPSYDFGFYPGYYQHPPNDPNTWEHPPDYEFFRFN